MNWYGWWLGATLTVVFSIFVASITYAYGHKKIRFPTPNHILIIGTWIATSILLYPLYLSSYSGMISVEEYIKTGIISVQHAIQFFAFNGYSDTTTLIEQIAYLDPYTKNLYTALETILCLVMPTLTVGVILSFFNDITSYLRYIFFFHANTYVFSELNEKSLALAKSISDFYIKKYIRKKNKFKKSQKALIVFTDINTTKDNCQLDLIEKAKNINSILLSKDINSYKYRNRYFSIRKVSFYLISDNEEKKIHQAKTLLDNYDISEQVELRLFSDSIRSELFRAAKDVQKMKFIRVNDIQTLIYHNFYAHGIRLFQNAREINSSEKLISAVIIGLGKYGLETLKALTWFCQMTGYNIKINAFDLDENAKDNFTIACPELMSTSINGLNIPGEAQYDIKIHAGINIHSPSFWETLTQINDATYIFIGLGNDELNLSTAVNVRMHTERIQYIGGQHKPDIETVIYDSYLRELISEKWDNEATHQKDVNTGGTKNFKGQHYHLHIIGDLDHFYSVDTLINSELEKTAKDVHCAMYPEEDFWRYEYNYRSSLARALHEKMRQTMGLDSPELEHKRWNAYMRSEGYQYSGNPERITRNDLGKLHNDLIPFFSLDEKEREKDNSAK